MPRKEHHTKDNHSPLTNINPQQFLLKFIEKNFERREIDEQSFTIFNKFASILGKELEKKTTLADVEGFVTMVRTVLLNYQYLNRGKNTFCLYLQLLEICMTIFQKAVTLGLSREICCELLDVLWPLYETSRKQEPFTKMQDKFSKITMPKQLMEPETMTKVNEMNVMPPLFSPNKYEALITLIFRDSSQTFNMRTIIRAFMSIQGENYLDPILQTLIKCIQELDSERFKKVLKVYLSIGESSIDQSKHLSILLTKVLASKSKLQFIYYIFADLEVEKLLEPNYLFFVSITALDCIFTSKTINDKTIELMRTVGKYLTVFKKISHVMENQKLIGLYNKVITVLLTGKSAKQMNFQDPKMKRLRSTELIRQKLQKFDREDASSIKKFSFIHELANQLSLAELEDDDQSKKQQDQSPKAQMKLQPLKSDQVVAISTIMKKIFLNFFQNQKLAAITKNIYSQQAQKNQFLKLCAQNITHIAPEVLQLILIVYIPLLSQSLQFEALSLEKSSVEGTTGKESSLMKIIKLHLLESKIEKQNTSSEEIYRNYYKAIHQKLVSQNGSNFDFLALTILHQYMEDPSIVIGELAKSCLQKIEEGNDRKASYFRCNIALIASILDLRHNIVIKLSYNRIKMHTNKLNNPFMVQDFLSVSEVKQNRLFVTGPRIQLSKEKESQLELIRQFITKLFVMTDKLGSLINLSNSEQNSYYYMILIQLCTLCMQKMPKFGIQSEQIQAITKLRKNNKYSLAITIGNEIVNILKQCTQDESNNIGTNNQIVLLHLLIKLEMLFYEGLASPEAKESEQVSSELNVDRMEQMGQYIKKVLHILGKEPEFQVLKIINKGLDYKEDLIFNQQYVNFSFDQIEVKKNKLKEFIKHFHIIKFYSEATTSNQVLLLMIIKTGLRLLEKVWEKLPAETVQEQKKETKALKLLYDNKNSSSNESQRKTIQAYTKLRLLGMTSQSKQNKLSLEQIKAMTKSLEENHDEVSRLIISEQNQQSLTGVESLFQKKTNFIAYLLEQIIKSDTQSSNEREISLLTLNLLKALIDNNNSVLEIAKKYTFQTLENSEAIPTLVLNRTKKSVEYLKELEKSKSIQKLQHQNELPKPRICQKEEEKILEESKKIYMILSKMLNSANNLKTQKQKSISKMVQNLLEMDEYSSIYISVYIMREIMNIAPILKNTLSKESFHSLTDRFFGQLMALRQIYEGVTVELNGLRNGENIFTIATIINFFIDNFYSQNYNQNYPLQLTDSIVLIHQNQKENKEIKAQQENKQKKYTTMCLLNQKKSTFKCIKCDPARQLCMHCVSVCHKDHPVIYIQPASRVSKSCQCSEDVCKINPIYEKKREAVEKKKNKIKEPVFYKRGEQNNRAYMEEFGDRANEYLENMLEQQFDEEQNFNLMLDGTNTNLIRPGNQGLVKAIYRNPNEPNMSQARLYGFPSNVIAQPYRTGLMQPGSHQIQAIPAHNIFASEALNEGSQITLQRYNNRAYEFGRPPQNQFQSMIYIRQERQRERQRRERQIIKEKQRQRMREKEKEQMRAFINESKYGMMDYGDRPPEKIQYPHDFGDTFQEENPNVDRYYDQDYKGTQKVIENKIVKLTHKKQEANQQIYDLTVDQSFLLPIFMSMTVQLCEDKTQQSKQKEPQINWHIKLINPVIVNPGLVHTSSKMCQAKAFITRLAKTQGSFHPSPCVSRAPIAVSQKFVFILSGPKIGVHLKQVLITYLLEKNGTQQKTYPCLIEQHLQFQPHSISVGHKNYVVVAGLHQINVFEYESSGQFTNRNSPLRHTINNDNINKIKLTQFGIFVGLNRQVRLLSHNLQIRVSFKIPDILIKQWYIMHNSESFTVHITCSEGYIFYAEGNSNSTGQVNFIKKINDLRTNRPVGVYVMAKNIEGCGNLMFSTYKDKNIGHCLGRLSSQSALTDLNYVKLNNQGLDPVIDKYCIIGLSDLAPTVSEKQQKQLFLVSILKEDKTYDVMGVHRGLLTVMRMRQDVPNGPTKYQMQMICGEEEKCEYFEIIWLEDKKNWFILSMCEDGGLRITMPTKIPKSALDKELTTLKEKKFIPDRNQGGKSKIEQSVGSGNKAEESETFEKLSNSIKEQLNIKTIKECLQNQPLQPNNFLTYLETSQILRPKEDYSISTLSINNETKAKKYEIKLVTKKKIVTGLSLPEYSQVFLPTRKVEGTFEVGFTYEEALYFYAFGVVKFQVRKIEDGAYTRDNRELKRMAMLAKNREGNDYSAEEKMFLTMAASTNKTNTDITVYGEPFEIVFKPKVSDLMKKIQKFMNSNNPFELSEQQKLQKCLKNCNLLLSTSLGSNNSTISPQESSAFLQTLRNCLVVSKKRQQACNRLYPQVKKCLYKTLLLQQHVSERKSHVFNDQYSPLRYSMEVKIKYLYELLSKGQITDQDLILLVNQLYGIVCGAQQDDTEAVNQRPQVEVFLYFVAKYPAMMLKIYKKIKVIENAKILYRVIPLYIYTYTTLKFLGYHLEWILPALYQAVGKCISGQNDAGASQNPKPSILSRFVLYHYLKEAQKVKLEPWLRNVEGTDVEQCLKEVPPLTISNSMGGGNNFNPIRGGFGGLGDFGLIQYPGQFQMEDEQAMIKKAIEESQREAARPHQMQEEQFEESLPQKEGELQMQMEENSSQSKGVSSLIKDLIEDSIKQVDYTVTNIDLSCQKSTILYVLFKLALSNLEEKDEYTQDTFNYLCHHINRVIQKLCSSYQEITNASTHSILMMWLNLFGIVAKQCHRDSKAMKSYETAKDSIMTALGSKFKIENIKKLAHVPNLFCRQLKGSKISSKAHFIYGFISVLQRPCEATFVLLTLGCYWLFPHGQKYYQKTKYIETIRENEKTGNINKIYETAISNLETWREVGDPEWLEKWVEEEKENWTRAIELLALYYE